MPLDIFLHMDFIGILSMRESVKPQNRISENWGSEVASFQLWVNSTRHILPADTWYRGGASPYAKRANVREVQSDLDRNARVPRVRDQGITGRLTDQNRTLDPGVTVDVP